MYTNKDSKWRLVILNFHSAQEKTTGAANPSRNIITKPLDAENCDGFKLWLF